MIRYQAGYQPIYKNTKERKFRSNCYAALIYWNRLQSQAYGMQMTYVLPIVELRPESLLINEFFYVFQIRAILGEHGIVVISRSGTNPEKFIFQSDLLTKYKKNIDIVTNWVPNEVSSTLARRYLRRGLSVKYMLDDNVVEYIRQQKLYGVEFS